MPKLLLCEPFSEKALTRIQFPALAQVKKDGARCLVHKSGASVTLWSRNEEGKQYRGLTVLEDEFVHPGYFDGWYDGELLFGDLERKASNGLAGKAIKGTITESEASLARLELWDYVTETEYRDGLSCFPYAKRWEMLVEVMEPGSNPRVDLVTTWSVNSLDDIRRVYRQVRLQGEEGLIIKDLRGTWSIPNGTDWRSPYQVKVKAVLTAEMRVIGMVEGKTGKTLGKMGALHLRTDDDLVECWVGTGFSDADRRRWWNERGDRLEKEYLPGGNLMSLPVIEVRYNALIADKDRKSGTLSLYLPRYVRERPDRDTTSTLEEMEKAEEALW